MIKPTLVIVNSNYPNPDNKYGDVFVHSRLKHYVSNFDIKVVGWKKRIDDYSFVYEGIEVFMVNTEDKVVATIKSFDPSIIGFHFIEGWMYKKIVKRFKVPIFIWVHGGEALGWYRRLFQLSLKTLYSFARYMVRNTIQMTQMHSLINYANKNNRVTFIFVSQWMRSITETDTQTSITNSVYIPNPIDPALFQYRQKAPAQRKKILLIRSFDSKKYANDVAIAAIEILSKKPFFEDLSFSIYGVGKYFSTLTRRVKTFSNVSLNNFFLENKDIPQVHKDYGIFLCPTRQDAQGVSMCEAMSSGLVPISTFNTAIPEFVENGVSGYLTNSAREIAEIIEHLYFDENKFLEISKNASEHIRKISSTNIVVDQELSMLMKSIG